MIDICINNPDGRETRLRKVSPVQTRRGAEAHERKLRQALEAGTFGEEVQPKQSGAAEPTPTSAAPPTVMEFVEVFVTEHCEVEQHSAVQHPQRSHDPQQPHRAGRRRVPVDEIRSKHFGDIKRAMVRARAQVKPKTINNALTVLSRMVRFWYEREDEVAPRLKAGLLRLDEPEADFYEPAEYEELVAGAAEVGRFEHALILLMGDAGLREGEVRALQWSDIRGQPLRPKAVRVRVHPSEGLGRDRRGSTAAPPRANN